MTPIARTTWLVLTLTSCGGGTEGGASKSDDTTSGGVAGTMGPTVSVGMQAGTHNQTLGSGAYATAGGAVASSGGTTPGGGSAVATAGSTSIATTEVVEVTVGAACAPVGAKACSAADDSAVVTCGSTGVWAVTSSCTGMQRCSSRNDSVLGTCRTMDCPAGSSEWHCIHQYGALEDEVKCSARGFVIARRKCLTNTCYQGVCNNAYVPGCDFIRDPNNNFVSCGVGCPAPIPDACTFYGVDGGIAAPILDAFKYIYIHGSSDWQAVPECPEVRKLIIQYVPLHTTIEVPSPYWVTFVESYQKDLCHPAARTQRCTTLDQDYFSGGLAIVTTDPNAPAFVALLRWRGDREGVPDNCYPNPE